MNLTELDVKLEEMRFAIDGKWEVKDTALFFNSLFNLYNYYGFSSNLRNRYSRGKFIDMDEKAVKFLLKYSFNNNFEVLNSPVKNYPFNYSPHLKLSKIQYASPGFGDILGIGDVIGHIKDVIFRVIEIYQTKETKELENNKTKVEIEKIEIENELLKLQRIKEQIAIFEELGLSKSEIKDAISYEVKNITPIARLVTEKKLIGID